MWLGLSVASVSAQELSTAVYTSEDELEVALDQGEIDLYQFLELRELLRSGIDSAHLYLIDNIPNLLDTDSATTARSALQQEQLSPFLRQSVSNQQPVFTYRATFAGRLQEPQPYRYYQSLHIQNGQSLAASVRLAREYSADEPRIVERSLHYRTQGKSPYDIVLGNYHARFGLGGLIGYRGALVDYAEELGSETLLFPDYTGYNGLYIAGRSNGYAMQGMVSIQRDADFSLFTGAAISQLFPGRQAPSLIVTVTSVRNRELKTTQPVVGLSLFESYHYPRGHVDAELIGQASDDLHPGGIIVQGVHHYDELSVAYAGWGYSDRFDDLTGGGLSGRVQRTREIADVEFSYRNRHRGQEGGTIRTSVPLRERLILFTEGTLALVNADTGDIQMLAGLVSRRSDRVEMRLDYLAKYRHRDGASGSAERADHQVRLENRVWLGKFHSRQYIAARWNDRAGHFGVFLNPRYTLQDNSEIEVWFSYRGEALDAMDNGYIYIYVRTAYRLLTHTDFSLKLSHWMRDNASDSHQTTLTANLEASW